MAANAQTKQANLGCESACRLLPSTPTIAIYYYYSARKLTLLYNLGLSRPVHCSNDVLLVPKAVLCSGCLDKYSNPE